MTTDQIDFSNLEDAHFTYRQQHWSVKPGEPDNCANVAAFFAVDLGCISNAMSALTRYNGNFGLSCDLARHSMLVAELVRRDGGSEEAVQWALLHDVHEILIGDVTSPNSGTRNDLYYARRSAWDRVIQNRHGLKLTQRDLDIVHHWDKLSCVVELEFSASRYHYLDSLFPVFEIQHKHRFSTFNLQQLQKRVRSIPHLPSSFSEAYLFYVKDQAWKRCCR